MTKTEAETIEMRQPYGPIIIGWIFVALCLWWFGWKMLLVFGCFAYALGETRDRE